VFPYVDPLGFKELDLINRLYSVLYSLGFGVVFGTFYELLRARGALPLGVRGGLAYGIGVFLVGILPSEAGWRDKIFSPMELIQLACQYVAAGAAVGAVACRLKDSVRRNNKPEIADASVMPADDYWRGVQGSDETSIRLQAPPRWNVISVCAPVVGFLCGSFVGIAAPHFQWFLWGFSVWLAFAVLGLLSSVIALGRTERLWGLTAAGLIMNAALVFWLAPVVHDW
jgi:hypothetical protein